MTYKAGIIGTGGIAGMGILGMHDKEDIGRKKVGGFAQVATTRQRKLNSSRADIDQEKLDTFGDAWNIPEGGVPRSRVDAGGCEPRRHLRVHPLLPPPRPRRGRGTDRQPGCDLVRRKPIAASVTEAEKMIERLR